MKKEIACQHLLKSLSEYIDGELDPQLCAELEQHLCECQDCQVVVDTTRKTIELYHTESPAQIPGDVRARLFARLDLDRYIEKKS